MYARDIRRGSESIPVRFGHVTQLLVSALVLVGLLRILLLVMNALDTVRYNSIAYLFLLHFYLVSCVTVFAENAILVCLDVGFRARAVPVYFVAALFLFLLQHVVK